MKPFLILLTVSLGLLWTAPNAAGQAAVPVLPGAENGWRAPRRIFIGGGFAMPMYSSGPIIYPLTINVIDRARFGVADLLIRKGQVDEAIAEINAVIEKSPDRDAVSAAHLSLGNIAKAKRNDAESALKEYGQVKGALANYAGDAVAEIFREKKQPANAATLLEGLIAQAEGTRSIALLLATTSKLYDEAGDRKKAIETLRRGEQLIPADPRPLPPFMGSAHFKETLRTMAQLKEQGKTQEADELVADLQNPMAKRIREAREQRERQRGPEPKRGADPKANVPPEGEIEIKKKPGTAPE